MAMALSETDQAAEDIAAADFPKMRLLKLPAHRSGLPERVPPKPRPGWIACSPATAKSFNAAAYFFGREIHRETGVPIGLIAAASGSTQIEPWTPQEGLALVPSLEKWHTAALEVDAKYRKALVEFSNTPTEPPVPAPVHPYLSREDPQRNLSTLFNGMVAQVVPYGIRGAIWYQGESNRGDSSQAYFEWMTALVRGWRAVWGQGEFPFYYVQIGALDSWRPSWQIPEIWEGQTWALSLPNTGMAVIHDLCGDLKDIHPKQKREVGRRLALWALATWPKPPADWNRPALEYSYAGRIGLALEPIFRPIGFNKEIALALVPGMAAREVAVSALGTVYSLQGTDEDHAEGLIEKLRGQWELPTALAFLAWFVFAPQCISTLAVTRRETGGWAWPVFMFAYLFAAAYAAAGITYWTAKALL
jgi:hypothetical protein